MRSQIIVTRTDFEALHELIEGRKRVISTHADRQALDALEGELDRAKVVEPSRLAPDVVTMNSNVRLRDLDSGDEKTYRLVFPMQAQAKNAVSILAPIGTALLGYRAGDIIEWRVPKGLRRLKVLEVQDPSKARDVILSH